MPGPTLDEYNAALAELAAHGGGEPQLVTPEEYMSVDPSVQFMSQPDVAAGPPQAMLSPADQAIQQFALQLQAQEEQSASAPEPAVDPLADFGARLAPGVEPELPMVKYEAVNPYQQAQQAPMPAAPAFRPRRGGGLVGKVGRMAKDARATGMAAQQEADRAGAARDEALQKRREAIEAGGAAQMQSAQEQARLQRTMQNEVVDELERRASDENVAQAKREMFVRDYEKAQLEADAMTPPRDRRGRQTVVMGALAVALSGIGDAIAASGGTRMNSMQTTLGIIDAAIERDLQAQREARASAQGKADRTLQRLDVFDKLTTSEQAASVAREAAIRAEYAGYMSAVAQENEGTALGAQAMEASQALLQQSEAMKAQLADEEARASLGKAEQLDLKRAQMAAQAGAGASPMRQLKLQEQALKNEKLRKELGEGPGRKLNEGESKIFRSAQGAAPSRRNLERGLREGMPWFGTRGVSEAIVPDRFTTQASSAYDADLEQIADVVLRDKSGAVISDSEIERELRDARSGDDAKAERAVRRLLERYDARARSVGIDPLSGKSGDAATADRAARGSFRPRR